MLIEVDDKKTDHVGSSALPDVPPPSFQESVGEGSGGTQQPYSYYSGNLADSDVFVPPGGEEPPPFTPYEAEFFVNSNGDIISHDRHLNQDGEALYRFLLSHAQTTPTFSVHLRGTHTESRTRTVSRRDSNGKYQTHHEHHDEDVVDFDFSIDIGQYISSGPVHWSVPDEEPAYRGRMYREIDYTAGSDQESIYRGLRRHTSRKENKKGQAKRQERRDRGLPPWASLDGESSTSQSGADVQETRVLRSSRTLRGWADEYCASNKWLKEFTYEKVVYGWHVKNLEQAIIAAVKSTYYTGRFTVEFKTVNAKIYIRPDNKFSRMLSNNWVKFILIILFIYPFIWLYKRFGSAGGGRWEVCGGAYALKSWQLVDPSAEPPPPPPFPVPGRSAPLVVYTGTRTARQVGLREGEWFQRWEGTIRRAVTGRLQSRVFLKEPDDGPTSAALRLDGYRLGYIR